MTTPIEHHRNKYEKWLRELLHAPEVKPILTYEEVIKYFVTDKPADTEVCSGLIVKDEHNNGHLISQFFLDDNDELIIGQSNRPYGRQVIAEQLDEELNRAFDGKDLIVVK